MLVGWLYSMKGTKIIFGNVMHGIDNGWIGYAYIVGIYVCIHTSYTCIIVL